MRTEKEFEYVLREKGRKADINKEYIDKAVSLFNGLLGEISPVNDYFNRRPFIVWEDGSWVYDNIKRGECPGTSIIYYARDIEHTLRGFMSNDNEFQWFNFYDVITSKEFIYDMGVSNANRTDQNRAFTCFSGVYLLYSKGEVVYVGQSNNIFNRISGHRDKEYDKIEFIPVYIKGIDNRIKIEYDLIKKHKPKYNSMHNKVSIQSALDSGEYIED